MYSLGGWGKYISQMLTMTILYLTNKALLDNDTLEPMKVQIMSSL